MNYRSYIIKATSSGGKAGYGCNKTASIQVRDNSGTQVLTQFRYTVGKPGSCASAMGKARAFVDALREAAPE